MMKETVAHTHPAQKNGKTAHDLRALFNEELRDIYWVENALVKAIPKMIKNASSGELFDALTAHLDVTHAHVKHVERVFESVGIEPSGKKCEAMEGLIREASSLIADTEKGVVRDAAIIAAAQKIEHYEICAYGTLCSFAKTLDEMEAIEILQQILDEEKEADITLTKIAEGDVNSGAASKDKPQF